MENGIYIGTLKENENTLPLTDRFFEEISESVLVGSKVIMLHYSDYGGSYAAKMIIKYFQKEFPDNIVSSSLSYNGEEAVIFGPMVEDINSVDDIFYTTGLEDFMFEEENDLISTECDNIIAERYANCSENEKQGIYIALSDYFRECANFATFGLDYSERDLDEYISKNIHL